MIIHEKICQIVKRWAKSLSKRWKKLELRYTFACDIPNIRKLLACGTVFPHPVGIVISKNARLGKNCKIWQNVTIGAKTDAHALLGKYPVLKDNVLIYAGATVFGDITIGEYAVIGANAVVTKDVLPYAIVAGIPACQVGVNESVFSGFRENYRANESVLLKEFARSKYLKDITSESVCIDCGANLGAVTSVLADLGAKVYAFEPHPLCVTLLGNKFGDNPHVHIIPKAVLNEEKKMHLFRSVLNDIDEELFSESSSLYASKENITTDSYDEVDTVDLAKFIDNLGVDIDLLKLDVEGAEYAILEKMIETGVIYKVKYVLVETHEDRIPEIRPDAMRVRGKIREMGLSNIHLDWM